LTRRTSWFGGGKVLGFLQWVDTIELPARIDNDFSLMYNITAKLAVADMVDKG